MFYHVVMMRLTDVDEAFLARVRDYEGRIRRELDGVRGYQFGRNVASRAKDFAWAVIGVFDSAGDHERYQVSSVHQEMKQFMAPHIADIVVCDLDSAGVA